ncbi:MAG: tRNA (adenosine(37)-N6)-threonylcarbamoyltransferase complex ATPase subunit type 1 TsaE [Burkholderiales bacterium]|nr:tRNA (adenosine(37)-N6)-threonylcarbamoyltransferase complex ATPase subunit type 1 TsaE [Burkholderiales bacterium]
MTASLHLPDASAAEAVGAAMAGTLSGGMVVALHGDLGTGKTTLARGALRALGWTGTVKSPTYTLVEYYPFSSLYLYHFDFYRFADPSEWETAGLADCFRSDSVCLVEWPERVAGLLPVADLDVVLSYPATADGRDLLLRSSTAAGDRCRAAIEALFLPAPG